MKQNFFTCSNILFLLFIIIISYAKADLPVHCLVEDVEGAWTIRINKEKFDARSQDEEASCGHGLPNKVETGAEQIFSFDSYDDLHLTLDRFYKVYQDGSLVGSWTPVYDQSFVIFYKNSVITAPYKYYQSHEGAYKSECKKTMIGWYVPNKEDAKKNWACFFAFKTAAGNSSNSFLQIRSKTETKSSSLSLAQLELSNKIQKTLKYEQLHHVVDEINDSNLLWQAEIHNEFKGLSFMELRHKLGLRRGHYDNNFNDVSIMNDSKVNLLNSKSAINFIQINKIRNKMDAEMEEFLNKLEEKSENRKEMSAKSKTVKQNKIQKIKENPIPDKKDEMRDKDSHEVDSYDLISKYLDVSLDNIKEETLPRNWDWRNVGGKNYVPKIKRQGNCGSCYVFSSVTSLEARLRIKTDNKDTTEFSKQYPISCNFYSEGCDGGYPFLVGKFFNEFEIVPEDCFPYTQTNSKCQNVCDYSKYEKKYRVKEYGYLGGYYGATNEVLMLKEIRARGPIPGNIMVPYTFNYYKKGIFSQSEINKNVDNLSKTTMVNRHLSWEKVEHSITLVGYGEENGVKFWIGMNTWGPEWGENGFFRILRGENECSIESMGDILQLEITSR